MDNILTGNIWKQVAALAKASARRLAAVAYVSSQKYVTFRGGDVVVCDASDETVRSGGTAARVIDALSRRGVEIYSRSNLHSKVVVFGKHALIGSCNLSNASEQQLTELALLSDRRQIVSQATAFVHSLMRSSRRIDKDFIARILKIKVKRRHKIGRRSRRSTTRFGHRVWIVSVKELKEDAYPDEKRFAETAESKARDMIGKNGGISWIRFTGKSRFRLFARAGDVVIQIWESLSGKRISVIEPIPVVLRQNANHWTRFYLDQPNEYQEYSWKKFKKETRKLGIANVTENSVRELSPREILLIEGLWG